MLAGRSLEACIVLEFVAPFHDALLIHVPLQSVDESLAFTMDCWGGLTKETFFKRHHCLGSAEWNLTESPSDAQRNVNLAQRAWRFSTSPF